MDIGGFRKMSEKAQALVTSFLDYLRQTDHFDEALRLMFWDLRTGAPKRGVELRSEAIGTLSDEVFRRQTSEAMERFLNELSVPEVHSELDEVMQATVRVLKEDFERQRKIPPERQKAFVMLTSRAESVWEEAKESSNFSLFEPYLEQIVEMQREFAGYLGGGEHPYDALLSLYEPGITVKQLDIIFGQLRDETVKLLQAIVESGVRPNVAPALLDFDVSAQREWNALLLRHIGYDFEAGRMDETVHPFQTTINRYDARITTKFLKNDVRSAIFSTIHEGGHALYEQGVSPLYVNTPLSTGTSMGMHESQSRFYENMLGRSQEFWMPLFDGLVERFPKQLSGMTQDEWYAAINDVEPSLIRIEADEVTYNLHIMIRYEIEKGLIEGSLQVRDLPIVWREKMQEYLGITPSNDAEGVLQDVHWAGGMFGYFPSYALGNLYGAQIARALYQAIPDALEQVKRGELLEIKHWLNENVHRYGRALTPGEILVRATGEPLDGRYLVEYLRDKYSALYGLSNL